MYVIPFSFEKLFARTDGKNNKIFNFRTEQKLSVYGGFEGSILPNSQKISSLLCNCDGGARFGVVSGTPVPAETRIKSGFSTPEALQDGLF